MRTAFDQEAFQDILNAVKGSFSNENTKKLKIEVAGKRISLVFTDERFRADYQRAFSHVQKFDDQKEDFTFNIVESTNVPIRKYLPAVIPRVGEVKNLCDANSHVCCYWNHLKRPYAIQILDFSNSVGYLWKEKEVEVAEWDLFSPIRMFFHNYFLKVNKVMLHAAAIGYDDKAVMLVGKGGSGKSSTVLSCLESPLSILSDDYLIVEKNELVEAHSIYSNARFILKDLDRLGFLKSYYDPEASSRVNKAIIFLNEVAPKKLIKSAKIKAILVPEISDKTCFLETAKSEVLNSVIPSTVKQIPQQIDRLVSVTKSIVESVPCYRIKLGPDHKNIILEIQNFLSSL